MEARVSLLTPCLLLRAAVVVGLLSWAPSAAADATKDECIAANESAQDLRQGSKLREAREKLMLCLAASCPHLLREDCAQRLEDLRRAIPTVVFDVRDAAGRALVDVTLSIDGNPVGTVGATAMLLDPGLHAFRFEVSGVPPVDKRFILHEGERDRHISVVIGSPVTTNPTAAPISRESTRAAAGIQNATPKVPQASNTGSGDGQRLAGWMTSGAGVVAMGAGTTVAAVEQSSGDTNSGVGLGIVALGVLVTTAGVILLATAPKPQSTTAVGPSWNVGLAFGGAMVRGTF